MKVCCSDYGAWRSVLAIVTVLVTATASVQANDASEDAVTINTSFPGGNVKVTAQTESSVNVEPDLRGGRPWFYWHFEATSTKPGKVSFVFPEKVAGFKNGAIGFQGPAVSSDTGKTWNWMGTDQVDGDSFFYVFKKANERVRFAVTIPYLQTNLDEFLKKNASNPHLKTSVLTKSRNGRDVELLQIGKPGPEVKAMLVTGRHHAAETIASYVLEGFLQAAMSESESAKEFRQKYVLFAVPFVDKDGVEEGAFTGDGRKIDSTEKTRSIEPFDLTKCDGAFEFGYSTGYLGYPFVRGRVYQAYFYDEQLKFIDVKKCLQFRKVTIPDGAKFAHLEFNQAEVSDVPLHAGAGRGSFVGRISNFKGPVDVHFHHNTLVGNRRLGLGYCGGRRWLIEDNLFAGNGGTAPGYGIDLEDGWEFMQDVVIRNNRFKDNLKGDLVICAGSELLIEGNTFEHNVVVHARPHNYTFRNNQFNGGHVGYKTRTGVARIHDNTYKNCTLSIVFDTKAVADGINRKPGQAVATPPLTLVNETLDNVEKITGTYFNFTGATMKNSHFVAGEEARLIDFSECEVSDSTIQYKAEGPPVTVETEGIDETLKQEGPGLNRRRILERKKSP